MRATGIPFSLRFGEFAQPSARCGQTQIVGVICQHPACPGRLAVSAQKLLIVVIRCRPTEATSAFSAQHLFGFWPRGLRCRHRQERGRHRGWLRFPRRWLCGHRRWLRRKGRWDHFRRREGRQAFVCGRWHVARRGLERRRCCRRWLGDRRGIHVARRLFSDGCHVGRSLFEIWIYRGGAKVAEERKGRWHQDALKNLLCVPWRSLRLCGKCFHGPVCCSMARPLAVSSTPPRLRTPWVAACAWASACC